LLRTYRFIEVNVLSVIEGPNKVQLAIVLV